MRKNQIREKPVRGKPAQPISGRKILARNPRTTAISDYTASRRFRHPQCGPEDGDAPTGHGSANAAEGENFEKFPCRDWKWREKKRLHERALQNEFLAFSPHLVQPEWSCECSVAEAAICASIRPVHNICECCHSLNFSRQTMLGSDPPQSFLADGDRATST